MIWRTEIVGKHTRTVVVMFTHDMKCALDTLNRRRKDAAVDESNNYLFATQNGLGHLRGSDVVRKYSKLCKAKNPEFLRATRLRKHVATVSQIMNLQENELDVLAGFLGHDLKTHREYYRLPESTLQVAKVSKLLLKMEKGELGDLAGKGFDDIEVNSDEGKFTFGTINFDDGVTLGKGF